MTSPKARQKTTVGAQAVYPAPRGVWTRQKVRAKATAERLFSNEDDSSAFREDRLDHAGYKLSMGPEYYVSPAHGDARASVKTLDREPAFFIPPGQFAFLLTEEIVRIPDNAFAFIALRSKAKFKGLVNVSGFHADPGFHGRLIFAVFNAGPGDVHIRRGEELFMIAFCDLEDATELPRKDAQRQLHIPMDLILPLSGQVQSLAGLKENIDEVEEDLDERLNAMEREVAILRWALALIIGGLVALVVRTIV